MMIDITNYRIHLAMGKGTWNNVPEITDTMQKELNEIGYTGKLKGKPMSFQQYFDINFPNNTRFKIELISRDAGEYTVTWILTRVKL